MKFRHLLTAIGTIFFGALSLHAQFTWNGLAGDNDISTGGNWVGGVAPTGSGSENLFFAAQGSFDPAFNSNFAVNNITLSAGAGFYNLTGGAELTLNGNVTTQVGATSGMLIGTSMILSAGTHTFNLAGSDIYLFNQIDQSGGPGNIVKTGVGSLIFDHYSPATFTGFVDLQQGRIYVHNDGVLGTGLLMMDGGTLIARDDYNDSRLTTLPNAVSLSANANFGETGNMASITITGITTIQGGVANVGMHVNGDGLLTLGSVTQTTVSGLTFDGDGATRITGASSFTGGTTVTDGTVIFGVGALPTTGGLNIATGTGYLGTEDTTAGFFQTGFLNRFNKPMSDGIIGLDSPDPANPLTFGDDIDLTGFNANGRLGSSTAAILMGTITPQGSDYLFGGRGILTVNSNLTDVSGAADVQVRDGLQLYLGGNNTYTGDSHALAGAIIFSGPNALPSGADIYADSSGYIGQTESAGLTVAAYLGHFYTPDTFGVVGFDADNPVAGRVILEDIDFSAFDQGAFLGTSTNVTFDSSITITPYGETYRFTGFRDGHLTVDSILADDMAGPTARSVVIGLNAGDIVDYGALGINFRPSVTLDGNNTYTGGTLLQSGQLILGNNNALGGSLGGTLTIGSFGSAPTGLSTDTGSITLPNGIDFGSYNYDFTLGGNYDFTLGGALIGNGGTIDKVDGNTVTLSGDNSGLNVDFNLKDGGIIFASDTAAGTGMLNFSGNSNDGAPFVEFSSANPTISGLNGGYTNNGDGYSGSVVNLDDGTQLTINQAYDTTYFGRIYGAADNGIVKTGTGTLTLVGPGLYNGPTIINQGALVANGENTYTNQLGYGPVTINGGTLILQNTSLPNPSFTVNSGGTLAGIGTISYSVSINSGATIAPGVPGTTLVGTLTIGNLTLSGGGTYQWNLQNPTTFSQVVVGANGPLTLDGTVTSGTPFNLQLISLDGTGAPGTATGFLNQSYTWHIFDANLSSIQGYTDPTQFSIDGSAFMTNVGAGTFSIAQNSSFFDLTFTPVPEPSTYALLGLGLTTLLLGRRRRRS